MRVGNLRLQILTHTFMIGFVFWVLSIAIHILLQIFMKKLIKHNQQTHSSC